jgi:hypothetical protein
MYMALEQEHDVLLAMTDDGADLGWHISVRVASGLPMTGVDTHEMLGALAEMGACQVIGRDEPARFEAGPRPIGWDMVLVGNTTRAAIEDVFVDMPDAVELVIEQIH